MTEHDVVEDVAAQAPVAQEHEDVLEAMRDVLDPELGINVVDLGLVYGVNVDADRIATIDMTLTSAACPDRRDRGSGPRGTRGCCRGLPHQLGLDAPVGPREHHR